MHVLKLLVTSCAKSSKAGNYKSRNRVFFIVLVGNCFGCERLPPLFSDTPSWFVLRVEVLAHADLAPVGDAAHRGIYCARLPSFVSESRLPHAARWR